MPRHHSPRTALRALGATALTAALFTSMLPATARADGTALSDGRTAATAAASCYEIKQQDPAAADGVYWLFTPALGEPQQFFCDQTTDGGGWVLIGRGRDSWSQSNEGLGTAAQVRSTVTGTGAFQAAQLSARTVGQLLNGAAVSSLPDGVRLRRALDTAGSAFQESRFTFASPRTDWSWLFASLQRVGSWTIGDQSGSGGTTKSFGTGSGTAVVRTETGRSVGYANGFGYGDAVGGSADSSSWVYKGTGYARPFTQVYLRPRLLSTQILTAYPTAGTAARAQGTVASSRALPTVWGVNGLGAAGTGIQDTEVGAFTESSGRVYVGGNFAAVQRDAGGSGRVGQSYLAAFDVRTGAYAPGFTPVFDNQVKALATLPDGRIVAGGQFTKVNGVAANGLVVLDPTTGAIDTRFTGRLINALTSSGGRAAVRALDVQDGWLYVGGSFTHAAGGTAKSQVYSRGAVRLSVTDGTPDRTWTAEFDGTVISLDASSRGDRVYFAGYFSHDKKVATLRAAALNTTDAAVVPWTVHFNSTANYQQAVREVGDRVWIAGSEHMVDSYHRGDLSEASRNLMAPEGGDGQALSTDGTNVYAGCHCYLAMYSDARTDDWTQPGTAWTQVSKIESTGAWNAASGAYAPGFSPSFTTREGAGTWALFTDSTGVTWMGGDFTAVRTGATGKSWAGGYARFAPVDSTAPIAPTALTVSADASSTALTWKPASDDRGSVSYQVMRDDRVVATTASTSIQMPGAAAGTRWFVRTADPAGNLSASTAAVVAASAPPASTVLVASGSVWSALYPAAAPAAEWTATAFDDGAWQSGPAPIGFGDASVATTVTSSTSPKPLTVYLRKRVTVADPRALGTVTLTTRADDGVVLYLNGTEVGRSNMPSGIVTNGTYASSAVSTKNALAKPVTFTVPGSAFVAGANVLSAEVHLNYRATPGVTFDLEATAR